MSQPVLRIRPQAALARFAQVGVGVQVGPVAERAQGGHAAACLAVMLLAR